jgi:hypothetical protein
LELQKLGDVVEDIPSPHASFDNADEIIVSQDNIRCFFGNIRSSDTLKNRNLKSLSKLQK